MGMGQWNRPPRRFAQQFIAGVRDYLPQGNTLVPEVFHQRHLLLCWVLGGHLPVLFVFGVWQGFGPSHSAAEVVTPAVCLLLARVVHNRRLAAFFVTAGLVFCSSVIVHLSGGTIEAHFHFFILIGLIALYQDWVPFLWNVVFTVLSHGLGSSIAADLMFNHDAAQNRPWSWAAIHGVAVLAACVGVIVFWRSTEHEQQRNTALAADLVSVQAESAQRQTVSEIFVNLARRNQSLLDRQLHLIAELEQRERSPEGLGELFKLDHLATRIRRNAESLLVLSGESSPRRWGRPVPLGELVRAAAAEVEDYARVDVAVNDYLEVSGRAVADLAHLLAELIENATTFSPPTDEVRVRSHLAPGEWTSYVLSIEDTGVGMPDDEMAAANEILARPPDVDLRGSKLGFHVVSRLAQRYHLQVRLVSTPGGGVTALVTLPPDLVTERRQAAAVAAAVALAEATGPKPLVGPLTGPWPDLDDQTAPVGAADLVEASGLPDSVEMQRIWPSSWHVNVPSGPASGEAPPVEVPITSPQAAGGWPGQHTGFEAAVPIRIGEPISAMTGMTSAGLVRRVPGAGLAAGLRRSAGPGSGGPGPNGPNGPGDPGGPRGPVGAAGGRRAPAADDRERVRSMLSRFQASQRAGRAIADRVDVPGPDAPEGSA